MSDEVKHLQKSTGGKKDSLPVCCLLSKQESGKELLQPSDCRTLRIQTTEIKNELIVLFTPVFYLSVGFHFMLNSQIFRVKPFFINEIHSFFKSRLRKSLLPVPVLHKLSVLFILHFKCYLKCPIEILNLWANKGKIKNYYNTNKEEWGGSIRAWSVGGGKPSCWGVR